MPFKGFQIAKREQQLQDRDSCHFVVRRSMLVSTMSRLGMLVSTMSRLGMLVSTMSRLGILVSTMSRLGMLVSTMSRYGMLVPTKCPAWVCWCATMFRLGMLVLTVFQGLKLKDILPRKFVVSVSTYTLAIKRIPSLQDEHEYRMSCICA